MTNKPNPESILQQIAQIQCMDRGSMSIIRHGPDGPYFNHQCYEGGRNVSRYVPKDQVEPLKEALAGRQRFEQLVAQHAELMSQRTRDQRTAGSKKKAQPHTSSSPKTRKSSTS